MASKRTESQLAALTELLELLRRQGVTEFRGLGYELKLGEAPAEPRTAGNQHRQSNEKDPPERPVKPYEHPSLWPNGQRPSFQ